MPLIDWNDRLSVGVDSIDKQHQVLIGFINRLYDALLDGKGSDEIAPILEGLSTYTIEHFGYEESLFAKLGFPGAPGHIREHEAFKEKLKTIQETYRKGTPPSLPMDVMTFLKEWLISHIQGTDKGYASHFIASGIK